MFGGGGGVRVGMLCGGQGVYGDAIRQSLPHLHPSLTLSRSLVGWLWLVLLVDCWLVGNGVFFVSWGLGFPGMSACLWPTPRRIS